jgi:crossover junction endodeoxyribonuclease RusA
MIKLTLPWPPSINHAKHFWRGRVVTSKAAVAYRKAVAEEVLQNHRAKSLGSARLEVHIQAFPPDRHRRDLDNIQKVLLDALQAAGLFDDDEQIDYLSILRAPRLKGGMLNVQISEKKNGKVNDKTKEKKDGCKRIS